jgi:molybdopterin molybdotransferase
MTGAPIPPGADTVVRFEDALQTGDTVTLARQPTLGQDVRLAGEDVRRGDSVLAGGTLLRPQEIGMLAALGRSDIVVVRRPRVAIMSTGDEVVPLGQPLAAGQIHDSNGYSLAAQVVEAGGEPLRLDVAPDRESVLLDRLEEARTAHADLVITSGGVSVGDFDFTKQVLSDQGRIDFWWVNMKPGRPLAFGTLLAQAGASLPLLALPGNPVAAMMTFLLFGRPALRKAGGRLPWYDLATTTARLREGLSRKDGRRHYLRVRLSDTPTGREATLTGDQGSGILLSMVQADGLAVIPEDCGALAPGDEVQVLLFPSTPGSAL